MSARSLSPVLALRLALTSFLVNIVVAVSQPEAWQFYDFGCQGSSRLTVATTAPGCASVPGLAVTASMFPGLTDFRMNVMVSGTAPAGPAPDPAARYVLARLDFDHTATVTGSNAPLGKCGAGDFLQCFGVSYALLNGGGVESALENGTITWNNPSAPGICPFPVPTKATTWGRLKAIYR